jgi:hypothetical protein
VLGDDHPATLASASKLASGFLRPTGVDQGRQLNEDSYARYRRLLGEDHPDTLTSANNLDDERSIERTTD